MQATILPGAPNREEIARDLEDIRQKVAGEDVERPDPEEIERQRRLQELATEFLRILTWFLEVFDRLGALNKDWRRRVFRGECVPDDEMNSGLKDLYAECFALSDHIRQRAEYYGRHVSEMREHFYSLAAEVKQRGADAKTTFLKWVAPTIAPSPALRTVIVPLEEAERVRAMLRGRSSA